MRPRSVTDSQGDRWYALVQQLQPLAADERVVALRELRAKGEEEHLVHSVEQYFAEVAPYFHLPPAPPLDRTGECIDGKYTLNHPLGAGGMGVVYHATELLLGGKTRFVAVKLIHPALLRAGQSNAVQQFGREIATLSQVRHPNVVPLYTCGIHPDPTGGTPFMVMEFVQGGRPLTDYAEQEHYIVSQRVALFYRVCEGVKALHEHDTVILHRDLKPTNILVNQRGRPVILDFGLAQIYDATRRQDSTGGFVGTPAYMSPEQAEQAPLDPRSDVYTLGVILCELLTGQRPYEAIMQAPLVPEPPSAHNPECAGTLDWIVTTALAKEPSRRYQTVAALQRELQKYLEQTGESWRLYREDEEDVSPRQGKLVIIPQQAGGASSHRLAQFPGPRRRDLLQRLSTLYRRSFGRWKSKRVPKNSYEMVLDLLPPLKPTELLPLEPIVRYAREPDDLWVISALESAEYGAHSIDAAGLVGWWRRYPKGVHLVEMGAEIVGALGLWPIANRVFDEMIRGTMEETQLGGQPDDIAGAQGAYPSWYVGDIIVRPDYRHREPHVLMTLLYVAVTRWCHSGDLAPTVKICAFGFTDHGRQFLTHFGFRRDRLPASPLGYPIYQLRASRAALQAALPRILEPLRATPLAHPEE